MKRHATLAAGILVLVLAGAARAQVVVDDRTTVRDWSLAIGGGGPSIASQFTLNGAASIRSATLILAELNRFTSSPLSLFSLTIMNDNANVLGTTTLATSTSTVGSLAAESVFVPITFDFGGPVNLSAGNYWLQLTHTGSPFDTYGVYWGATFGGTLKNTGPGGTVNYGFSRDPATYFPDYAVLYSLSTTAAVPEPSSLALGATASSLGLTLAWLRRRRSPQDQASRSRDLSQRAPGHPCDALEPSRYRPA